MNSPHLSQSWLTFDLWGVLGGVGFFFLSFQEQLAKEMLLYETLNGDFAISTTEEVI